MNSILRPWQVLLVMAAGWINRQQRDVIDYLRTENSVLREKLGPRRILLNDDQRRRLALKGKTLGRQLLSEVTTLFSPDTILRWHRELIARKWDYSHRRTTGRPGIRPELVELILQLARDNPTWGYDRIQGALANLGYRISDTTIGNVLQAHGIEPAPKRQRTGSWSTFLKAHWETLAATDFTTCEVWTRGGLITFYILVVMQLKTRRVEIAGITTSPDSAWIKQIARNLSNSEDGFLRNSTYLILDRDTKFLPLREYLTTHTRTQPLLLPPRSPNLNAYVERFMRTLKSECLDRLIFFGEGSLKQALREFTAHYHAERNHQGLKNRIITPSEEVGRTAGAIRCRERLGGMLRYYHRDAA